LDNIVVIDKVKRLKKLDGSRPGEGSFNIFLWFLVVLESVFSCRVRFSILTKRREIWGGGGEQWWDMNICTHNNTKNRGSNVINCTFAA
jgi:hypothetical protein